MVTGTDGTAGTRASLPVLSLEHDALQFVCAGVTWGACYTPAFAFQFSGLQPQRVIKQVLWKA